MTDWIGLIFFVLLIVGVWFGLRALANPRPRTSEDFEKGASENSSFTGALLNALHDVTDPGARRATEVRQQLKDGRYQKKKREGKTAGKQGAGSETDNESDPALTDN